MIISFAWTLPEVLAGLKDVTRRCWTNEYAARFKPGEVHQAWSASPHRRGRHSADIQIITIRREPLQYLLDDPRYAQSELKREGGRWKTAQEFVKLFKCEAPYRIEFKLVTKL